MNGIRKHAKLLLVALSCLAIGAGASAGTNAGAAGAHPDHWPALRARGLRGAALMLLARRAVHADAVVWTRGQGFVTVTFDRGTVDSVSGQQLTITEGIRSAIYKQVVLTIPTTALIHDNRATATLSQLAQGQRVVVVQAPNHTFVFAHTPNANG